ncbi:hypothetical protein ACFCZ1_08520 [Streptomyces sp. NPDC056224]|uniref:hypothetical protein n=1 Tax=Streptomyces sp. NPDC056224 TaxID=3345750 RepID=UPI0035D716B0
MSEIVEEIGRGHRRVGSRRVEAGEAGAVPLRRTCDAEAGGVWDVAGPPGRIGPRLPPVSGESAIGGRYRPEGNAGGGIREGVAPERPRVSWPCGPAPGFGGAADAQVVAATQTASIASAGS